MATANGTAVSPEQELRQKASNLHGEAARLRKQADLVEKQAAVYEKSADDLNHLESQISSIGSGTAIRRGRPPKSATPTTPATASDEPKRRGRPSKATLEARKVAEASTETRKRPGRPPGSKNRSAEEKANSDSSKTNESLMDFCLTALKDAKSPMQLKEVVTQVRALGYKSKAKDFPNMVLQNLYKLTSNKNLHVTKERDVETKKTLFRVAA